LKGFLNKNPKERLGCFQDEQGVQDLEKGFTDIKTHAFFKAIQWDLVSQLLFLITAKFNKY
jgi:atypical protein kinase C zeta type